MSKVMPQSASEIAQIGEIAGQLAIEVPNMQSFTDTMIRMGDSSNLSSSEAADSMARFANVVGMSQDKFSNLGSAIIDLGNNLATSEAEVMAMASGLAGVFLNICPLC